MPRTGMLILHGFTGSRATVAPMIPVAEALGLRWSMPQLRGHWTTPDDLHGVTYQDMLADALAAYDTLAAEVDRVAVVGLSVGGLIGLDVVQRREDTVALAVMAPALRYTSPLTPLAPLLTKVMREFKGNDPYSGFSEPRYAEGIGNYERFPTATFLSVLRAIPAVESRLGQIRMPVLVLGARNDRVVPAAASQLVYNKLGSPKKQLLWFERSGHEMLVDCEGPAVTEQITSFLRNLR